MHADENINLFKLILESNLLNFAVAFSLVVYVLCKFLPESRTKRKQELEKEIAAAKEARELAELKLKELEQEIEKTKAEAKRMVVAAKDTAEKLGYKVMEEARIEIDKMNLNATKEIEMQKILAIESIKKEIASAALAETERVLRLQKSEVDALIKSKLKQDLAGIN